MAALTSRYFPDFFLTRNHGFRYGPSQYSSTLFCRRSRSIPTTTGCRAFGIGNPGTCQALCLTVLITWGGAMSGFTFPISEKSNAKAFSRLYSISINSSFSLDHRLSPTTSRSIRSFVSREPFGISENLGVTQSGYCPGSGQGTSSSFDFSNQSRLPPGLEPSVSLESTGRTLLAFVLYAVATRKVRFRPKYGSWVKEKSSTILDIRYSPALAAFRVVFGRNTWIAPIRFTVPTTFVLVAALLIPGAFIPWRIFSLPGR